MILMEAYCCLPPSSCSNHQSQASAKLSQFYKPATNEQSGTTICCRRNISFSRIKISAFARRRGAGRRIYLLKAKKDASAGLQEKVTEKKSKGSIAGAVALIIGTSIGSGILALPQKASPAGLVPSSISMIVCWGFLLVEALLLAEINVSILERKKKNGMYQTDDNELEIISIRTMAQETLGKWGGNLASITYIFLGYTSMVAYSSKSAEIIHRLVNTPEPLSGFLFTIVFSVLISVGGTRGTDQVNRWLTAMMIGLLLGIELIAVTSGGWSGLDGTGGDWEKVPATIPVMIFSLVYHDLAPVLCAYLGGDLNRIRSSIFFGSIVPLLALLIWDAISLGLSAVSREVTDPLELLMNVKWSGVPFMVESFSLLAVGTSLIGTLLSFSEFFKEQLNNLSSQSTPTQEVSYPLAAKQWLGANKMSFVATTIVVVPTLLVSTTVPDAFSAATDIAGGYCMTLLYGVLPPAMAWVVHNRRTQDDLLNADSRTRPALLGIGLFACGIVIEQIFQDVPFLHSY